MASLKSIYRLLAKGFRIKALRNTALRAIAVRLGEKDAISKAKENVFRKLIELHGYNVMYGHFKGMRLGTETYWGKYDVISKILGVYEEEVTDLLCAMLGAGRAPFVDLGAADGYYAIGVAVGGMAENVFAFEISQKGRDILTKNAASNGCSHKITISGEANFASLKSLMDLFGSAVILIDIEGAEYELLDDRLLDLLSACRMIIELHPGLVAQGEEKEAALMARASKHFTLSTIYRESYCPNRFPELNDFKDDERLLAVSEGRSRNPKWLVLDPKS